MKANVIKDTSVIVAEKDSVHAEAIRRFEMCTDAGQHERELALEDARFAQTSEGQWDDIASSARQDRPRYTINKVAGAIDTVVGDQRQNEIAVKVRPMSSGATDRKSTRLNYSHTVISYAVFCLKKKTKQNKT